MLEIVAALCSTILIIKLLTAIFVGFSIMCESAEKAWQSLVHLIKTVIESIKRFFHKK